MAIAPTITATVLIADPDVAYRQVVSDCLTPRYRVITASSIAETLDMIARYRPSVLLLELNQPDGDGRALITRLKTNPETRSMVIGCLTTRSTITDKIAGFQAGADDYVVKPVNTRTFMYRIVLLSRVRHH